MGVRKSGRDGSILNAKNKSSLYEQLYLLLREKIEEGGMAAGEKLPSERELSSRYGVSRSTMRKALEHLRRKGLIYKRQGVGAYVAVPHMHPKIELTGFSEEMQRLGLPHAASILQAEIVPADSSVALRLGIAEGDAVNYLQRLRLIGGLPAGIESAYVPCARCTNLLDYDFSQLSLYKVIETEFGIKIGGAEQMLSATLATAEESELLGLACPQALLVLQRFTSDVYQQPIEYARAVYNPQRYHYTVMLSRL